MRIEDREQLFENPAGEYRGRPFWAWNGKLTEEELLRQIDIFGQMGFSGFFYAFQNRAGDGISGGGMVPPDKPLCRLCGGERNGGLAV